MGSNYDGADSFSESLTLCTDDDVPSAVVFRLPNERLLDNDIHLRNRVVAVETSSADHESRVTTLERGLHVDRGRQLEVFDDFLEIVDGSGEASPYILGDSGPWVAGFSDAADVAYAHSAATNQSSLRISRVANTMSAAIFKTSARALYTNWRMRAIVLLDTNTTEVEVGLIDTVSPSPGNGSGSCLTAYFDPGTSANWLLRTRNSVVGNESEVDTGVAAAASTIYRFDFGHNGTTYTLAVNGAAATLAGANVPHPTDFGLPVARMAGANTGDGVRVDLIHAYSVLARW
jgi:hypothetical protein